MSKKKVIAVMTSYYINNYGSILQAVATKEYLSELDLDVVFVNYVRDNVRNRKIINPKWSTNIIKKFVYKLYRALDDRSKNKVFSKYVKCNLALTPPFNSRDELYSSKINADIFCVGSDQMWNSEYNGGVIGENFLDFAPKDKKKISFSTSMGMTSYDEAELKRMKVLLEGFSFISVREKSAVDILTKAGIRNVHQILDPTLLISGERWKKLIKLNNKYRDYVLIYQLNDNPDMQQFARKIAEENSLSIIQITYYMSQHWSGIKSIYDPKIDDFVSLIANADYIVTDSFHGTAFSINLHKEFFSFSPGKYADRICSILSLVGLESRLVDNANSYAIQDSIDYGKVEEILSKCREEAATLIKNGIE